jgi:hypothetical protein
MHMQLIKPAPFDRTMPEYWLAQGANRIFEFELWSIQEYAGNTTILFSR